MTTGTNDFIRVSEDGKNFEHTADGSPYLMVGCNYFPLGIGWAPKVWSMFNEDDYRRDFPLLHQMGMNTVRIFMSFNAFMPEYMQISEECLSKCEKMMDIAAENGIRIIYSGLSAWEGIPNWFAARNIHFDEYFFSPLILENLEFFYSTFAQRFSTHTGLLAIDLFNEPFMPWNSPNIRALWIEYLQNKYGNIGELNLAWGKDNPIQSWEDVEIAPDVNQRNHPVIWDYQVFRNKLSRNFVERCASAIKQHDRNHLVTIGCHQGTVPFDGWQPSRYFCFDPHAIGDLLDYISIHTYPYSGEMDIDEKPENFDKNMALVMGYLRYMDIGKPVVLEEYGLYGGGKSPDFTWRKPFGFLSQEQQAAWVLGVMDRSRAFCRGWLNWGFHDYPEAKDPTRFQGFFDDAGNPKVLGRQYPDFVRELKRSVSQLSTATENKRIPLDLKALVTDGTEAIRFRNNVIDTFMKSSEVTFDVIQ